MLSTEKHKEVQNALRFFKQEIENNYYIEQSLEELEDGINILVVRSARAEVFIDFLKKLEETNQKINLYVLGETDAEITAYKTNEKIMIHHLETHGRFEVEKINEYMSLIETVEIQKIIFLNLSLHSRNIFNVYEVVCRLKLPGMEVLKYMSKGQWMKYQSFPRYVRALKAYTAVYEWYVSMTENMGEV